MNVERCIKCGAENPDNLPFCGGCGSKFVPRPAPVNAGEDGLYYCYRHKKEPTRLTCGRCEKPVCWKCSVPGASGVRCRECAKHNIAFRPGAVVNGFSRSVRSLASYAARYPWCALLLAGAIIRLIMSFF